MKSLVALLSFAACVVGSPVELPRDVNSCYDNVIVDILEGLGASDFCYLFLDLQAPTTTSTVLLPSTQQSTVTSTSIVNYAVTTTVTQTVPQTIVTTLTGPLSTLTQLQTITLTTPTISTVSTNIVSTVTQTGPPAAPAGRRAELSDAKRYYCPDENDCSIPDGYHCPIPGELGNYDPNAIAFACRCYLNDPLAVVYQTFTTTQTVVSTVTTVNSLLTATNTYTYPTTFTVVSTSQQLGTTGTATNTITATTTVVTTAIQTYSTTTTTIVPDQSTYTLVTTVATGCTYFRQNLRFNINRVPWVDAANAYDYCAGICEANNCVFMFYQHNIPDNSLTCTVDSQPYNVNNLVCNLPFIQEDAGYSRA